QLWIHESKVELFTPDRDGALGEQWTEGRAGGHHLTLLVDPEGESSRRRCEWKRGELRRERDIQPAHGEREVFAAEEEVRGVVDVGRRIRGIRRDRIH